MSASVIQCFMLEPTGREVSGPSPVSPGVRTGAMVYRRGDTGEELHLGDYQVDGVPGAPPGAMWFADWLLRGPAGDAYRKRSPDGHVLVVRTPGGDWVVDGPARNCEGWTRTGVPPLVTATPSIGQYNADDSFKYHGWLRNGRLEEC